MAIRQMGESHNPLIENLRMQHFYPALVTEDRWQSLLNNLGHYRKCRHTGNKRATVLRDHDLILLALYRVAFPKANHAEINAFLYRCNYGNIDFRFYCPSQITICEQHIGLTRKVGSTTAYQALLPRNKRKRWCYWNLPFPFGIADIRRQDLILTWMSAGWNYQLQIVPLAYIGKRVKQSGLYSKTDKWNLLLAISGDPNGRRWQNIWTGEGTTGDRMISFLTMILQQIGPGSDTRRYCFIMDNLSSHHNIQMALLIFNAGHRLVFRAPYYPIDGPIEYVFNPIQNESANIVDGPSLVDE
ncbi:LOW QUALITY PROTEIN: hypothetical protein ACHAXR_000880, partial [Thalassiosira sp. AJA248-18]